MVAAPELLWLLLLLSCCGAHPIRQGIYGISLEGVVKGQYEQYNISFNYYDMKRSAVSLCIECTAKYTPRQTFIMSPAPSAALL